MKDFIPYYVCFMVGMALVGIINNYEPNNTTTPDYQGYESAYDKGFNDCLINQ